MANVEITLGKPVIIAQSDKQAIGHHWGPFQFPGIQVNEKGEWICNYHVVEDAASGYGKPNGYAKSIDQGKTWLPQDPNVATGLLLPNGDWIRQKSQYAVPVSELTLPENPYALSQNYGVRVDCYLPEDTPEFLRGWYLERKRAGSDIWETERYFMEVPGLLRGSIQGVFPYKSVTHYQLDPQGRLWHISYPYFYVEGQPVVSHPLFAVSEDYGHTFRYLSNIPYQGNPEADPFWDDRSGFTEPELTFLPDGSLMALLRTTDGKGPGPMYVTFSTDGALTWSKPEVFDDLGVFPTLMTLKNGVTVTTYGRPGLYVRATADPAGKVWGDRITIVKPTEIRDRDTCAYTRMIPVDDNTAYLVYSDFQQPNAEGIPVKTIMGCTISTKIV